MSERNPEFIEPEPVPDDKPNLIKDLARCVDIVVAIESEVAREVGPKERRILQDQISEALGYLMEQRESVPEEELAKFEKRGITGFQGLGGFNRYAVRGDGSIGLRQSHSFAACIKKAEELGVETPRYGF
jgi:hypothetical protein